MTAKTFKAALSLAPFAVAAALSAPAAAENPPPQAAENFLAADANADGALTYEEFKTLIDLNARYGIGRSRTIQSRGLYGLAFGRIDANGDGLATQDELAEMMARR